MAYFRSPNFVQELPSLKKVIRSTPGTAVQVQPNEHKSNDYFNNQKKFIEAVHQLNDL